MKDVSVHIGEMALEEFLKMVADVWHNYKLDLINYQNKCQLIRGWDELFTKVKEHTNSLQAMKFSPYYKVSPITSLVLCACFVHVASTRAQVLYSTAFILIHIRKHVYY